jgi:glyoxylase-like metal-dependent hydrolase (beta-lactamase superfamily II)
MEIIPGVHAIDGLGTGRAYLYQEAGRLTLIDTGLAGSTGRIFAAIEGIGQRPEELRQIVITHHHRDHAGSLPDIVERTGAQVLVHALDAPVVRGDRAPPTPKALRIWLLARRAKPPAPSRIDRELQDGDEIELDGGARVLHVPGHTAGSIALYVPGRKVLFTGDAAANVFGLRPTIGTFTEDGDAARASFRKLAQIDFEVACFGHGKPLDKAASLAFRKLADSWHSGEFGR